MDAVDMTTPDWAAAEWSRQQWEDEQMKAARLPKDTQETLRRLLNAYRAKTGPDRDVSALVETFEKLLRGHALVVADDPTERWQEATPGRIHARDVVRVRLDAYSDEVGVMHNGRRGRVIGVRYGDIIVRYEDGRHPPFDAVHHAPQRLERLIK